MSLPQKRTRVRYDPSPHPLRIARQKAGLTVEDLARFSGVPALSIGHIERRQRQRVYVDELVAMAQVLAVPWVTLVDPANHTKPEGWRKARL